MIQVKIDVRYSSTPAKNFAQDVIPLKMMNLIEDKTVAPGVVIVGKGKNREIVTIR